MRKSKKELKSVQMSFRFTETFRDALSSLAGLQKRSQANMLEIILEDFLARHPVEAPEAGGKATRKNATKKKAARKR